MSIPTTAVGGCRHWHVVTCVGAASHTLSSACLLKGRIPIISSATRHLFHSGMHNQLDALPETSVLCVGFWSHSTAGPSSCRSCWVSMLTSSACRKWMKRPLPNTFNPSCIKQVQQPLMLSGITNQPITRQPSQQREHFTPAGTVSNT